MEITPDTIHIDVEQIALSDREKVLTDLPGLLNKRIKPSKWFKRLSGDLAASSNAEKSGVNVVITSNPVGEAFDLYGGWKLPTLSYFVLQRKAAGYYRDYQARRRAGAFTENKFTGLKRVPFLAGAAYKSNVLIQQILKKRD